MTPRRKLRILFAEDYCHFIANGVDTQLARFLRSRGHEVHLLACAPARPDPIPSEYDGLHLHTYPLGSAKPGSPAAAREVWRRSGEITRRLTRRLRFDIACVYQPLCGVPALSECHRRGVPTVCYFLSPWRAEYELKRPEPNLGSRLNAFGRQWLQTWLLRRARGVIVNSRFMRRVARGMAPRPMSVIGIGVDTDIFRPPDDIGATRRRLGLPEGRPVVFTVRRLTPRMGLDNLLTAARRVLDERPEALFVIGGRGEMAETLKRMARDLGIERSVRFTGFIPYEDLPAWYQAADVFVLPTAALEGFGMVMTEAMACGAPVVATPAGAIPETMRRVDSRLLTRDTGAEAIAERILWSLADRPRLRRLGRRCRQVMEAEYSWDRVGPRVEAEFLRLARP